MGLVGACMGYPAGLIHEIIGTRGTYLMALVFGGGAAFCYYVSTMYASTLHEYWLILVVLWMAYGKKCPQE